MSYTEAKNIIDHALMNRIDNLIESGNDLSNVSYYAKNNHLRGNYSEVMAECFTSDTDSAMELLNVLKGEIN